MCEYTLCITSYQLSVVTAIVQYPADKTTVALWYTDEVNLPLLPRHTSRQGVQWLSALKRTTLKNLCNTAASLGMMNRTRHLYHTYTCVCVYTCALVTLVTVFQNCQLLLSMNLIFLALPDVLPDELFSNPWVPFHKMSQHPQEAKWLKFCDQGIVRLQFLENFH